jgi:hypothetical protein
VYVGGNLSVGAMDHTCKKSSGLETFQPIIIMDEWHDVIILVSFIFVFL